MPSPHITVQCPYNACRWPYPHVRISFRVRQFKIFGRTWLVRQWLLPRTCDSTNWSVLNVYLVIKIRFIKYRFLKRMLISDYEVEKKHNCIYTNNRLQRFFVPSVQSCFMPKHLRHMIYQLNYGIEYLGLGKVMWYQQKVSTQIARLTSAHCCKYSLQ